MVVEQIMETQGGIVGHEKEYPGVQQLVFTIIVLMAIRIDDKVQSEEMSTFSLSAAFFG